MSTFIEKFLDFTSDYESPTSFFLWSAIATVAAVMRDNCYVLEGAAAKKLCANLFILIHARSSVVKKGNPVSISVRLVDKIANTRVISGRASLQGVIKLLGETLSDTKGKIIRGSGCFIHGEELSSLLVDDSRSVDILGDWYDYHERWDNVLSGMGVTHLSRLCVTLFSATNDELAKEIFTKRAIYGGLLARIIFIHEDKRRRKNSLMYTLPRNDLAHELISHLKDIAISEGEILFDEDAKREYDSWYNSIDDTKLDSGTGIEGRMPTNVKKVSMILMKSEDPKDMVIQKKHVQQAIQLCLDLMPGYSRFSKGVGKGLLAEPGKVLLFRLLDAPDYKLSHKEVLANYWGDLDLEVLAKAVETFQQGGVLRIISQGNMVYYQLTEEAINGYKKKMEKENQ